MESLDALEEIEKIEPDELLEENIEEPTDTEQPNKESTDEQKTDEPESQASIDMREKDAMNKLKRVLEIVNIVLGAEDLQSRLDPILRPKDYKTTSILSKGEVNMCIGFLTFAKQSPLECSPLTDFVENYCLFKLSEGGFGIEQGIALSKSFSEKIGLLTSTVTTPEKPTTGMKDKGT